MFAACSLDVFDAFNFPLIHINLLRALHSVTIFLVWIKMLSFARGFKATSFLIRMIIEV